MDVPNPRPCYFCIYPNIQAVGTGEQSIKYLSPYVFKVAISNHRIVKVENRRVYFRYRKQKNRRWRTMSLNVKEFIRRFLQHVLPTGFMKVRYYGFLNPNSSVSLEEIGSRIELAYSFAIKTPDLEIEPLPPLQCPCCGGKLKYQYSVLPFQLSPKDKAG